MAAARGLDDTVVFVPGAAVLARVRETSPMTACRGVTAGAFIPGAAVLVQVLEAAQVAAARGIDAGEFVPGAAVLVQELQHREPAVRGRRAARRVHPDRPTEVLRPVITPLALRRPRGQAPDGAAHHAFVANVLAALPPGRRRQRGQQDRVVAVEQVRPPAVHVQLGGERLSLLE